MKPIYLGGVRGYQSAVYRPDIGWSGTGSRRLTGSRRTPRTCRAFNPRYLAGSFGIAASRPAATKNVRQTPVYSLTVARQHRPGIKTKVAIVTTMIVVAAILTLVLSGGAQI